MGGTRIWTRNCGRRRTSCSTAAARRRGSAPACRRRPTRSRRTARSRSSPAERSVVVMRHGKYRFVASFLAIPLLLYVVYVISPYAQAFNIALTNWNGFSPPEYTGFANFSRMFHDRLFVKAVEHNLFLLLTLPLITVAIALFLSFMLNVGGRSRGGIRSGVWGSKFYRLKFFFPQVLAVRIIGVLFQQSLRPDTSGALNRSLHAHAIEPVRCLTNPTVRSW